VSRPIFRFAKTQEAHREPVGQPTQIRARLGLGAQRPETRRCWRDRRDKNKARVDVAPRDPTEPVYY
jgi:hypothetical protein